MNESLAKRIVKLLPHTVLVQRCAIGRANKDGMREVGGIILPDRFWQKTTEGMGYFENGEAYETQFVEILDIGDECELWEAEDTRKYQELFEDGEYGITVFCPVPDGGGKDLEVIDEERGLMIAKREDVLLPVIIREDSSLDPLKDYLIVKMDITEDAGGGIVKPEAFTYESWQGIVTAAGPDVRLVEAGDKVIVASDLTVHKFEMDGVCYACPSEDGIIAIVE